MDSASIVTHFAVSVSVRVVMHLTSFVKAFANCLENVVFFVNECIVMLIWVWILMIELFVQLKLIAFLQYKIQLNESILVVYKIKFLLITCFLISSNFH